MHNEHAYCDMREDTNFKGPDSSCLSCYFLFCESNYCLFDPPSLDLHPSPEKAKIHRSRGRLGSGETTLVKTSVLHRCAQQ